MVAELIRKKAAHRRAVQRENDKCAQELMQDLRECVASLAHNEAMFNLVVDEALVEARIYERQALRCRYRYLLEKARAMGLRVWEVERWRT